MDTILEMRDIGKAFHGVVALDHVNLGVHPAGSDSGQVLVESHERQFEGIQDGERLGLIIIHQEPALVRDLGVGKQQLVEIAKALSRRVKLLILDQPAASLNENEGQALLDLLLELKGRGITCILISHKLGELHQRRLHPPQHADREVVKGVDLHVRRGGVVGIAGLMGARRTEFAMSMFGRAWGRRITGEVLDEDIQFNISPAHLSAVSRAGIIDAGRQHGVGAKFEIYTIIAQLAAEGKCVIVISSEMPTAEASQEKIMRAIVTSH